MKESFYYKYDDLFNPTLSALHNLGGSGTIYEIEDQVSNILKLTETQANDIHKGNTTKLSYRLAWARNYLKQFGLIENSARKVWVLTEEGKRTKLVEKKIVNQKVKSNNTNIESLAEATIENTNGVLELTWQDKVIDVVQGIDPSAFERLCQRLLRELGFQNVEVTGRTNDGGIDGKGILKLGGVLSFHVVFQAKRYKSSVSPSIVRDFRGAMQGRADKGLIITTGTFTREAQREAIRDGATPIDLIDGTRLSEMLKELRLGIEVELVERVSIKEEWFSAI